MPLPDPLKIIIAGGGTGGHIFPAIAIANAIKEKVYNARILFVGASGRMEMQKVPAAGYHILGLNIAGLQRRITWKNLLVPFKLIDSLIKARNIIKRYRPHVVIGVGGYASAPVLSMATRLGVPTLIQEQNSYPGITNRLLAKRVDKICVAYEKMERFFPKEKLFLTGNPVRNEILKAAGKKDEALEWIGFNGERTIILVVGGSLGALSINEAVEHNLSVFKDNNLDIIWQTGKSYFEKAQQAVVEGGYVNVRVFPFVDRMDLAYAAADVVVSRAGAIAISEICALQKPSILVPSPWVAEDHQTKNALALVNMNAAVLIKDVEVKELLGDQLIAMVNDKDKLFRMQENMIRLYYRDSAANIAGVALSLVK